MKIKDLRYWLETLPNTFDETELVFRTVTEGEGDYLLAQDIPISACGIDNNTNEAYLCDIVSHQIINQKAEQLEK